MASSTEDEDARVAGALVRRHVVCDDGPGARSRGHHSDGHRHALERRNRLWCSAFENLEIRGREIAHQVVIPVAYEHSDLDEVDSGAKDGLCGLNRVRPGADARCARRSGHSTCERDGDQEDAQSHGSSR